MEYKGPFINELPLSGEVTLLAVVLDKDLRPKRNGGIFLALRFADRSGELDGKVWDNPETVSQSFERDDVVKVRGTVEVYNDKPQIVVNRIRRCEPKEYNAADFYASSARDPSRFDVEVFRDTPWTLVLSEEGQRTLEGLIDSTKALLETTAKDLLEFWQWCRDHPAALRQPVAQWPQGHSTQSTGFNSYAPGTLELAPWHSDGASGRRAPDSFRSPRRPRPQWPVGHARKCPIRITTRQVGFDLRMRTQPTGRINARCVEAALSQKPWHANAVASPLHRRKTQAAAST